MPQNAFFSTNSWSSGQPKNDAKTPFFHHLSPFHGRFCNCNSIGICTASQFYVQLLLLYTAWSNTYSEIGPEVRCNLLRLLARKITKRIHSSKPASLNHPILSVDIHLYKSIIMSRWRNCKLYKSPSLPHLPPLSLSLAQCYEKKKSSTTHFLQMINWISHSEKCIANYFSVWVLVFLVNSSSLWLV